MNVHFLPGSRTAIAIMAFGFLVERFDSFPRDRSAITFRARSVSVRTSIRQYCGPRLDCCWYGDGRTCHIRFINNAKSIDQDEETAGTGSKLDVVLASMLILLGVSMFLYLSHAFILSAQMSPGLFTRASTGSLWVPRLPLF